MFNVTKTKGIIKKLKNIIILLEKIQILEYNINEINVNKIIFRAGCNSLPVVKVHDPTQYSRLIW